MIKLTYLSLAAVTALVLMQALPLIGQTALPGGELVVRDSAGQAVGQLITIEHNGTPASVSMIVNSRPVILTVQRSRLMAPAALYYDQANCQGVAFINGDGPGGEGYLSTPAAFAPDGTIRISPSYAGAPHLIHGTYDDLFHNCTNQNLQVANSLPTESGPNLLLASPLRFQYRREVSSRMLRLWGVPSSLV